MSFVIPQAAKKSVFEEVQSQVPGPANYSQAIHKSDQEDQYCAPFNTSSEKISYFNVRETQYGPGSYDAKHWKDISKPIRVNESSSFASKVQRFVTASNDENQNTDNKNFILSQKKLETSIRMNHSTSSQHKEQLDRTKNLMNNIRKNNQQNRVESIKGKQEFIRVILTSSSNTELKDSLYTEKGITGKTIGPGSYQSSSNQKKVKGISKWSHEKPHRFKTEGNKVPGPGSYESKTISKKHQRYLSSSFASSTIRSHMDSIIYKTNLPLKIEVMKDHQIKNKEPGPGTYNSELNHRDKKSFNYGAKSVFPKQQRAQRCDEENQPGPGSYNPLLLRRGTFCNQTIKQRRNQIFQNKKKKSTKNLRNIKSENSLKKAQQQFIISHEEKNFKHNSNKQKVSSLQERCFSRLGSMNTEARFKQKQIFNKKNPPGPGEYEADACFTRQKGHSVVFNSLSNRSVFLVKQTSKTPYYNLFKNDIGYKAEKTKRYLQNLKKINVQKSPFQTKAKRFHEPNLPLEAKNQKKINNRPTKPKIIQQSSVFASKTGREEIFKGYKNEIGPGQYEVKVNSTGKRQQLEKKSFNIHYNYEPLRQVKPEPENISIFL